MTIRSQENFISQGRYFIPLIPLNATTTTTTMLLILNRSPVFACPLLIFWYYQRHMSWFYHMYNEWLLSNVMWTRVEVVNQSISICPPCLSTYFINIHVWQGDARKVFYLSRLGEVPTYLCLLFILVRFAVLLYLEVRKKWFPFASGRRVRNR